MVEWIKEKLENKESLKLYGEYALNTTKEYHVTVIIKSGSNSVSYSAEMNEGIPGSNKQRFADPEMAGYITRNLEKLLEEATGLIHTPTGSRSFIIEDTSGIHSAPIDDSFGRFIIDTDNLYLNS